MATWPKFWRDLPLAVFDVETTGLDPLGDRIIEVGIIRFEGGEVVDRYGQLIDPERPIPAESSAITGITDEHVRGMPTFADVAQEVRRRLDGVGLVAYNLPFDRSFLRQEFERVGLDWPTGSPEIDPLIFARQFFRNTKKTLGNISRHLGIPLEEAHRATHDAEVAGRVLYAFSERLPEELEQLLLLQASWESAQNQERARQRRNRPGGSTFEGLGEADGVDVGLGPAYIYGDEADPLRALYMSVPEARDA